jgi:disulfide bond formation protein DsbB
MQGFLSRPFILPSLVLLAGMAATVGGALAFEHIGGYVPCALCLLQRDPYYYGLPVSLVALVASSVGASPGLIRFLILLIAVLMLVGAGMGAYHSGVEWGFWEGPSACSAPVDSVPTNANDILADLNRVHGPSCTVASFRFLGLSFAGWNVVASLALAAIALRGALRKA